jgi:hypothetical protein
MNQLDSIAVLMRERLAAYPPILSIQLIAEILDEEVPTIRARIRRSSFPITVRQEIGGRQYVLLIDLVNFLCTGEPQSQPISRPVRLPRNHLGLNGKRRPGRPKKVAQLIKQRKDGTNS